MGNRNFPMNGLHVCVDEIQKGEMKGRFYSPMAEVAISFESIEELLLKGEALFDKNGYPQAYVESRSFREKEVEINRYRGIPKCVAERETFMNQKGQLCTFRIIVTTRRNASWQGVLQSGEGMEIAGYDGEMELLHLLREDWVTEKLSE